ncbi:hypothetical protein D3C87_1214470 [compost metagenome]
MDSREQFENHPRFKGMDFTRSASHPMYYESPYANGAWDGWQAASVVPTQKVYGPRGQCRIHGCEDPATAPNGTCSGHCYD